MSYASEVLADSPAAYYRLGEASGATMADSSGNGRDGIYTNVTYGAAGALVGDSDTAITFGSGTSEGEVAYGSWMNSLTITIEFWVKTTTTAIRVPLQRDVTGNRVWQIQTTSTPGKIGWITIAGGNPTISSLTSINDGNWRHVVFAIQTGGGSADYRVYVDGVLDNNSTPVSTALNQPTATQIEIGGRAGTNFPGSIDEVAIYPGVQLSAARVLAHYQAARSEFVNLGLPAETDTALPITSSAGQSEALGLPAETDTALPVATTTGAVAALGLPTETDEAYPITSIQATVIALGLPEETDAALPLTVTGGATLTLGLPAETDEALAFATTVAILATLGLPEETDAALPVAAVLLVTLGLPEETDEALAITVIAAGAVILTQTWNRAGGRVRHASAELTWTPPFLGIAETDLSSDAPFARIYNNHTTDSDGQTRYDMGPETYAHGPMLVPQLIVDGVDVTVLDNVRTPLPDYEFTSPLGYGPSTWTFPTLGPHKVLPNELNDPTYTGDYPWCAPDAHAIIRWWDVSGETPTLVPELTYHAVLDDFIPGNGNELTVPASGWWAGQALREIQPPLFLPALQDIGRHIARIADGTPGVSLTPRRGPVTGIEIQRLVGMRQVEALNSLLDMAHTPTKGPFTLLPETWGGRRFEMVEKDTTTIHATFYGDGQQIRLQRERLREPDEVYGYGVAPSGRRVRNGRYPGVLDDPQEFIVPADYPFFDERSFGWDPDDLVTNATTDTGDGITVMQIRLQTYGLLSKDDVVNESGVFGPATEGAVNRLRFMVTGGQGLLTGMMTPNFWNALFNVARIGSSIWWARIDPMARKPWTIKWLLSSDGSIIGKNPDWEGDQRRVITKTNNYGAGFTRGQMFDFSEADLPTGPVIFGELDLGDTGGLLAGDVDPGTPITDANFKHGLSIRPGMNIRLPFTRWGDIVVHVSTVPVTGGRPVAHVANRHLNTVPLYEAIEQAEQKKGMTGKIWFEQNRSSSKMVDTVVEFDEMGGLINPLEVPGGEYKVFRLIAGQVGMIEQTKAITSGVETDFVLAFFRRRPPETLLESIEPNPLVSKAGWKAAMEELDAEYGLLYLVGEPDDLAGYSPGRQSDGDSVTGKLLDQETWPYRAVRPRPGAPIAPWMYGVIFTSDDTTLSGGDSGRMLWNQELVGQ